MAFQTKFTTPPENHLRVLLELLLTFMKISPLTFGGGIAMIPHIESEIVEKRRWFTSEDVPDIIAVSQSAPGSIAINASIYIGYTVSGIGGALTAMLGMLLPAGMIIILLTYLFLTYQDLSVVQDAFQGIRPAIIGLILFAGLKIGKGAIHDRFTFFLFLIAIFSLGSLAISPVFLIVGGALAGWLYHAWNNRRS
ncbi:chromate transporter [Halobacillus sp. H74]|uniref:chromate transporter n=1 Tax=Halobacillus sp. H74 TaxID=3457436 RepID=UPI003FCD7030